MNSLSLSRRIVIDGPPNTPSRMTLIGTLDAPQQQDEADVLPKLDFSERLSPVATLHGAYAMVVEWRKSVRVAEICFVKEESRNSLWTCERDGRSQKPHITGTMKAWRAMLVIPKQFQIDIARDVPLITCKTIS